MPKGEVVQNGKGRFYPSPDGRKPSITTIWGKVIRNEGLEFWRGGVGNDEADRVSKEGRELGSEVHKMVEDYLAGSFDGEYPFSMNPVAVALFFQAKAWLDENLSDDIAIEQPLVGNDYGGTPDIVGILKDGSTAIIDIKTSKQMSWEMGVQLAALENIYKPVDKLIILRVKKKPAELANSKIKAQVKDYKKDKDYKKFLPAFMGAKEVYYAKYYNDIPKETNDGQGR